MIDNLLTIIAILAIFLGLPIAFLLARDRLRRPFQNDVEETSRHFLRRLQNPDLAALERHFEHPLPQPLRELYKDPKELMRTDFEVAESANAPERQRWFLAFYQPADATSAQEIWPGLEKYFAFADDGAGNGYLIDPKQDDPPVLFHDHETGEITQVCDRMSQFMTWPRLEIEE